MTVLNRQIPRPFPDLDLPLRCFVGMTEDVSELGESEVVNTILGKTIILRSPWNLKHQFRLACSGPLVIPLPSAPFRLGSKVKYDSATWRTTIVDKDVGEFESERLVCGAEVVRTDDGRRVAPVVLAGKIVLFAPQDVPVLVRYRLRHACVVTVPPSLSAQVTGRETSWSLEITEEFAT